MRKMMILKTTLDVTQCSEIEVFLPNADGTKLMRTLTWGQVLLIPPNSFGINIPGRVSALLNPGEEQDVSVKFYLDGTVINVTYEKAISVFEILPYIDD